MENPATWSKAELVVEAALTDHHRQQAEDAISGEFRCGLSLTRQITDALRREGLLREPDDGVLKEHDDSKEASQA